MAEGEADGEGGAVEFGSGGAGHSVAQVDESFFQGCEEFGELHRGDRVRVGLDLTIEGVVLAAAAGAVRGAEALAAGGDASALFAGAEDVAALGDHGFSSNEKDRLWAVFLDWLLFLFYRMGR
jgi:hypothetical protein